jgi:hypothetical protein
MDDFLTCRICFQSYDNRKFIPYQLDCECQFIVCGICLKGLEKIEQGLSWLECPVCREKIYSSLNEIKKSFVTLRLIDAIKDIQSDFSESLKKPITVVSSFSNINSSFCEQEEHNLETSIIK